jgi:hypothetical protein
MEDARFNVAGRSGLHRARKPEKWRSTTMRNIYQFVASDELFEKKICIYKYEL